MTLAFGSITATFQNDIKKLVAYSTISQIGYLVCGCGFCCYEEVLIYLIVHALNKAFLFVLVGYTVHFFSGNTDMRQMGGAYVYSFDIAILLFGVCFNLAGLPYSAGFLGKEFLLFQVLRDDFISIVVRGCWLVSFFFTPIYMFILSFIVMFGVKKGSVVAYRSAWSSLLLDQWFTLIYDAINRDNLYKFGIQFAWEYQAFLEARRYQKTVPVYPHNDTSYRYWGWAAKDTMNWLEFGQSLYFWSTEEFVKSWKYNYTAQKWIILTSTKSYVYKHNFTSVTSRSTSYILFSFWIFFFFFGEFLLLLLFNYVSLFDSVTSHSFFLIKQHIIFLTSSLSAKLTDSINFYIYFLTSSSLLYLINLNYILNYNFFKNNLLTYIFPIIIFLLWLL